MTNYERWKHVLTFYLYYLLNKRGQHVQKITKFISQYWQVDSILLQWHESHTHTCLETHGILFLPLHVSTYFPFTRHVNSHKYTYTPTHKLLTFFSSLHTLHLTSLYTSTSHKWEPNVPIYTMDLLTFVFRYELTF